MSDDVEMREGRQDEDTREAAREIARGADALANLAKKAARAIER